MVNGQYAILALNDPFALGWNLSGSRDATSSFPSSPTSTPSP